MLILQTPSEGSKLAAATRSSRRAVAPAVCQVHVKEAENRNTDIPACNREDTAHDKGPTQLHLGQRERQRAVPIQQHNAPVVIRQTRSLLCRPPVVGYVNIPLPGAPARLYSDPWQEVISCATSASAFLSQVAGRSRRPPRPKESAGWTGGVQGLEGGDRQTTLLAQFIVLIFQSFCSRCNPMQKKKNFPA